MISTLTKLDDDNEDKDPAPEQEYYNLTHFNENVEVIMPQLSETKEEES